MKIAQGRFLVYEEDLLKVLNLPSDVTIINVENQSSGGNAYEFVLASPTPIKNLTYDIPNDSNIHSFRRSSYKK